MTIKVTIIKVAQEWNAELVQSRTDEGGNNGQPSLRPTFIEFVHERLGLLMRIPSDAPGQQTANELLIPLEKMEDGLLDELQKLLPLDGGKATRTGA